MLPSKDRDPVGANTVTPGDTEHFGNAYTCGSWLRHDNHSMVWAGLVKDMKV